MNFANSTDLDACPRLRHRPDGECSALCVPVTVLGTPMGVLHTTAPLDQPGTEAARARLEALAEQAGSRIGVLRAMASSELQATTDPLTGLLNRRRLEAALTTLHERDSDFAVAFFDLDHFKELNDTFGHETGDRALRSFARILRSTARESDLVSRWGGEEFVVVFPEASAGQAEPIAQRVAGNLADAVLTGDVPPFTVSVGLADSTDARGPAEVIRTADEAMFRAKQTGRDRIVRARGAQVPAREIPPEDRPAALR
jgi:diguanylate cyclase (GGDEF)-like protein